MRRMCRFKRTLQPGAFQNARHHHVGKRSSRDAKQDGESQGSKQSDRNTGSFTTFLQSPFPDVAQSRNAANLQSSNVLSP